MMDGKEAPGEGGKKDFGDDAAGGYKDPAEKEREAQEIIDRKNREAGFGEDGGKGGKE